MLIHRDQQQDINKISTTRQPKKDQRQSKTNEERSKKDHKTSTRYQQQDNQRKSKKDQCSYRIQRKIKERSMYTSNTC